MLGLGRDLASEHVRREDAETGIDESIRVRDDILVQPPPGVEHHDAGTGAVGDAQVGSRRLAADGQSIEVSHGSPFLQRRSSLPCRSPDSGGYASVRVWVSW